MSIPKTTLRCTNCGAALAELWHTRAKEKKPLSFRAANCPFCDSDPRAAGLGGSDWVSAAGVGHRAGCAHPWPGDVTADVASTVIDKDLDDPDGFLFTIMKASLGAEPCFPEAP